MGLNVTLSTLIGSINILRAPLALTALQGLPGVLELHQVTTEVMPPSLVMSHQSGKLLQDYFDIDNTLISLLAFVDLCKVVNKIHKQGWAL